MRPQDILMPGAAGLCCRSGGFHIDPVRPVDRAVITHGHSDHARPGHGAALATQETLDITDEGISHSSARLRPARRRRYEPDRGLVLEVAFEGLQRSARHKSGVAMRFPRISRLRWDKPPREADRLETLERMLGPAPRFSPRE
jgi:hypothetical protein